MMSNIYNINLSQPFIATLAEGFVRFFPSNTRDATILLPTQRLCYDLKAHFLNRRLLFSDALPTITPLGDFLFDDETEESNLSDALASPPQSQFARMLYLMRHLKHFFPATNTNSLIYLAYNFGRLWDEIVLENLSWQNLLARLPHNEFELYWQNNIPQLRKLIEQILYDKANGLIPLTRSEERIASLSQAIAKIPDNIKHGPLIIAGSTGSTPLTFELIKAVSELPNGKVIIAGFDSDPHRFSDLTSYHPQYPLAKLLRQLKTSTDSQFSSKISFEIPEWLPSASADNAKQHVSAAISLALHDKYKKANETFKALGFTHFLNLIDYPIQLIESKSLLEEAAIIAAHINNIRQKHAQQARHKPTIVIITANHVLADYIKNELQQYGILDGEMPNGTPSGTQSGTQSGTLAQHIDESKLHPLSATQAGRFLSVSAKLLCEPYKYINLLAIFNNPLCQISECSPYAPQELIGLALKYLPQIFNNASQYNWPTLLKVIKEKETEALASATEELRPKLAQLIQAITNIASIVAPLHQKYKPGDYCALSMLWQTHQQLWQYITAPTEDPKLQEFSTQIENNVPYFGDIIFNEYSPWLKHMLGMSTFNPPRTNSEFVLKILKPLDARLHSADYLFLAGLNSDSWPQLSSADPWLNPGLRRYLKLLLSERRIGLAALDFCQFFSSAHLILSRSEMHDKQLTDPSLWWKKITFSLRDINLNTTELHQKSLKPNNNSTSEPLNLPQPVPPLAQRPRRLSVGELQRLIRNPFGFYVENILGIKPCSYLTPPAPELKRGIAVHNLFFALTEYYFYHHQPPPESSLEEMMSHHLRGCFDNSLAWDLWRLQVKSMASAFFQQMQQEKIVRSEIKVKGEINFPTAMGDITIHSSADRIDQLADGTIRIIDYKTGSIPSFNEIRSGYAPRLPIEGIILLSQQFKSWRIKDDQEFTLSYWQLKETEPFLEIHDLNKINRKLIGNYSGDYYNEIREYLDYYSDPKSAYYVSDKYPSDYHELSRLEHWLVKSSYIHSPESSLNPEDEIEIHAVA